MSHRRHRCNFGITIKRQAALQSYISVPLQSVCLDMLTLFLRAAFIDSRAGNFHSSQRPIQTYTHNFRSCLLISLYRPPLFLRLGLYTPALLIFICSSARFNHSYFCSSSCCLPSARAHTLPRCLFLYARAPHLITDVYLLFFPSFLPPYTPRLFLPLAAIHPELQTFICASTPFNYSYIFLSYLPPILHMHPLFRR